jgi:hypothetical protein
VLGYEIYLGMEGPCEKSVRDKHDQKRVAFLEK